MAADERGGSAVAQGARRIPVDAALFAVSGLELALEHVELSPWGVAVRIVGAPDADAEALVEDYLGGLSALNILELLAARHPATRLLSPLRAEVEDDVGTAYRSAGRPGIPGRDAPWSREWRFSPHPPHDATRLIVRIGYDSGDQRSVEVPLR